MINENKLQLKDNVDELESESVLLHPNNVKG
jgi:hypothetical protein